MTDPKRPPKPRRPLDAVLHDRKALAALEQVITTALAEQEHKRPAKERR